jgi:hypothetical protein
MASHRKVILNYPPVSSVWHLPVGISQLAPILRNEGHEVIQRYGHIIGLEHVLKQYGGEEISTALEAIRDSRSDISALYAARMAFERVSQTIPSGDKFVVERNNVSYVSADYDGSIEGVLRAVRKRESHIWYRYFMEVEIPLARDFRPDVYGISVADERQLIQSCILASLIKDELPKTTVVLGGNFWSRVIAAFSDSAFGSLFNFCDGIVYREGFQPMQTIVASLKPSLAPGTVWRDGDRVVTNPPTETPTPFETLPTPEFDGGARQWSPDDVYPLYTMSNCPMSCGFCAIAAGSDTYLGKPRIMSPQRIAEHMVKLGGKRFDIVNELFPVPHQIALGKELKRIGYDATWQSYLTVTDDLLDPEKCHQLHSAGCRAVQLGLETLSPETLKREHKQWNHPQNYGRILENLERAEIQTHVFVLVGLPGEPLNWGLRWLSFLNQHGNSIMTIKGGRYRLTRISPEDKFGTHDERIEALADTKPIHLNRDFHYRALSRKRVEAMRDLLEQACREHWGYAVTSTIPWWINRGRYSWDDLRKMSGQLPKEPDVPHIDKSVAKIKGIVRDELGREAQLNSFQDVVRFADTI